MLWNCELLYYGSMLCCVASVALTIWVEYLCSDVHCMLCTKNKYTSLLLVLWGGAGLLVAAQGCEAPEGEVCKSEMLVWP